MKTSSVILRITGFVLLSILFSSAIRSPITISANASTATGTPVASEIIAHDSRGFEMVYIPGGSVEMGTTRDSLLSICMNVLRDGDRSHCNDLVGTMGEETDILQAHSVKIPPFWLDRYEVTIEQYKYCINSGPGKACQAIELPSPKLTDDPHKPQLGVDWYDAVYFCNTRSARLPTEAEWEYAARGPKGFFFPWGNTFIENYAGPLNSTYPVGSIPGNKSWAGVYDLSGNAAEWVDDLARPYSSSSDWPQGFPMYDTYRVARGGSWATRTFHLLAFYRDFLSPDGQHQFVGFRCARSSDPRK